MGRGFPGSTVLLLLGCCLLSAFAAEAPEEAPAEKGKVEKIMKTNAEWKKVLTDEQFHILREKGTERAFTGKYWDHKEKGIYLCAACGLELFHAQTKFESGTGWPSFYQPHAEGHVVTEADNSFFMKRMEVLCGRCGGHLGHVFPDGPKPTGQRYCINSGSLAFKADP